MKGMVAAAAFLAVQEAKPEEFLPMKQGTSWIYVSEDREMKVKVAGKEKIGETECTVFESAVAGQVQRDYFTLSPDGLRNLRVAVGSHVTDQDPPMLRLKFPLKKGEKWEWQGKQGERKSKASFTNEGEEEISVPAGKYKAWKIFCGIEGEGGGSTSTTWYAAGVGMIRQDTCVVVPTGILKVSAELKSFEAAK